MLRGPRIVNKSAASAASLDVVQFQAVIKPAASAASPRGGRASGRLDHYSFFYNSWPRHRPKNIKMSDNGLKTRLKKQKSIFHPSSQAQGPGPGPVPPGPRPRACEEGWKIKINGSKSSKKSLKNERKNAFLGLAKRARSFIQKLKVPKWVCRSTLASFCYGQPFFCNNWPR